MKQNIKVAKQLVKLAKSLVAKQNIANQAGEYTNFTGTIDWRGVKGKVKNADFYLASEDDPEYDKPLAITWAVMVFTSGIWEDGTCKKGIWKDGNWKKGTWQDGIWNDGTWENGVWVRGEWNGGTWKDGTWKDGDWYGGTWYGGTWKNGFWGKGKDKNRNEHGKGDSPNKWKK